MSDDNSDEAETTENKIERISQYSLRIDLNNSNNGDDDPPFSDQPILWRAIYRVIRTSFFDKAALLMAVAIVPTIGHELFGRIDAVVNLLRYIANLVGEFLNPKAHAAALGAARELSANASGSSLFHEATPALLMFGLLAILLTCLWVALFSNRPKHELDRAWDLIKIIAGFITGTLSKGF